MDKSEHDLDNETDQKIDTDAVDDSVSNRETDKIFENSAPSKHGEFVDKLDIFSTSPNSDHNFALVIKDEAPEFINDQTSSTDSKNVDDEEKNEKSDSENEDVFESPENCRINVEKSESLEESKSQQTNAINESVTNEHLTKPNVSCKTSTVTSPAENTLTRNNDDLVESCPSSDDYELCMKSSDEYRPDIIKNETTDTNLDTSICSQKLLIDYSDNDESSTGKDELSEDPDSASDGLDLECDEDKLESTERLHNFNDWPKGCEEEDTNDSESEEIEKTDRLHLKSFDTEQSSEDENDSAEDGNTADDASNSESDFAGFDSINVEKTAEIIEILCCKQQELLERLQKPRDEVEKKSKNTEDESGVDVQDNIQNEDEELQIESKSPLIGKTTETEDTIADKKTISASEKIELDSAITEIEDTRGNVSTLLNNNESSLIPARQDRICVTKKPQPTPGIHINIFEEQVPSGSKRVKKKRKFFGDFEDFDNEKPAKKQNVMKPTEDGSKIHNISIENKENYMTDDKINEKELSEEAMAVTPQPTSAVSLAHNKIKRSSMFDISNPLYKEPFKCGWKREICYRNLPEGSKGKTAYVTYFNPQGKKFKSIRHIVEHLPPGSELSTQHFTFSKERIFNEPSEFELLRYNRPVQKDFNETSVTCESDISNSLNESTSLVEDQQMRSSSKKKSTSNRASVKTPKSSSSKQTDSDNESGLERSLLLPSVPSSTTPKIVIKGANSNSVKSSGSKYKSNKKSSSRRFDKNKKKQETSAQSISSSMLDQTGVSDNSPSTVSRKQKTPSTCSISCPLALGSFPTLQCTICLSLYHFECCGVDSSFPVHSYVCKTCRDKAEVSSKLLLAISESSQAFCNNVDHSRITPKNSKIVDGVTTWLPSSSSVRLSSKHAAAPLISTLTPETHTSLLQSVLELDGRRYLIVPKESIVSISPNTNVPINTYPDHGDCVQLQNNSASVAPPPTVAQPTFLMNSSDVNSDGVLLVPVTPPGSRVASPHYSYSECYNHSGFRGTCKRKFSDESNGSVPFHTKMARLDTQADSWKYRSALTLANVTQLYDALTLCFKYLTVRDLLRVSMSCKYLNRIASESSLWTTVRLKNSRVRDWEGFAKTLCKYGTKKLDMRKMLCSASPDEVTAMWDSFVEVIPTITSLEHIEFSRCSSSIVETVAETCPNLAVINAVQLKNGIALENFTKLKYLRELRLKSVNGLIVESCNDGELESELEKELDFASKDIFEVLSLTSVKKWDPIAIQVIADLKNLRVLELGECSCLSISQLSYSISRLEKLEKLRLEQVTNLDPDYELFASLKNLKHFKSLELINVYVKQGFDKAIGACQNIEELLIIPLYKAEAVTTNRVIMDSLQSLSQTLKTFVWCLTTELITATHLYAERYDEKSDSNKKAAKKPCVDSIPILKSITKINEVEILSIRNLEKIIALLLPQARHKILKIPFNSTWRQNLSECFK